MNIIVKGPVEGFIDEDKYLKAISLLNSWDPRTGGFIFRLSARSVEIGAGA